MGVHDLATKKTKKFFDGMMEGVDEFTFDWETRNLYWTDSMIRIVMVVDSSLNYYTTIYKGAEDTIPIGIAVHPAERCLEKNLCCKNIT